MIDLIILSSLLETPKHGYQLKQEAGFLLGQDNLHSNLVYPLLKRFTSGGLVTRKAAAGERGQTRQRYALTALGKSTLIHRLNEFGLTEAKSFEAFVVRAGMFELLKRVDRERILDGRESYLSQREPKLRALLQNLVLDEYGAEVVKFILERIHLELDWIRRLRRMARAEAK